MYLIAIGIPTADQARQVLLAAMELAPDGIVRLVGGLDVETVTSLLGMVETLETDETES